MNEEGTNACQERADHATVATDVATAPRWLGGAREIGRRLHVARSTIQDNLKRTQAAGLAWPLAPDLTDEVLEQRLFGPARLARAASAQDAKSFSA